MTAHGLFAILPLRAMLPAVNPQLPSRSAPSGDCDKPLFTSGGTTTRDRSKGAYGRGACSRSSSWTYARTNRSSTSRSSIMRSWVFGSGALSSFFWSRFRATHLRFNRHRALDSLANIRER